MGRICLGAVAGAHGVRGLVKIKTFTEEPEAIAAYGPLSDETGERVFDLTLKGQVKGLILVEIAGVKDRDQAAALRGTRLYVDRDALPPPDDEDEFYQVDLIGLLAEDEAGQAVGAVIGVANHGAGDYLEVERDDGPSILVPFTKAAVPELDFSAGKLIIANDSLQQAKGLNAVAAEKHERTGQKGRKGS